MPVQKRHNPLLSHHCVLSFSPCGSLPLIHNVPSTLGSAGAQVRAHGCGIAAQQHSPPPTAGDGERAHWLPQKGSQGSLNKQLAILLAPSGQLWHERSCLSCAVRGRDLSSAGSKRDALASGGGGLQLPFVNVLQGGGNGSHVHLDATCPVFHVANLLHRAEKS